MSTRKPRAWTPPEIALGSARETRTNLEIAVARRYIERIDAMLLDHLDHIIAVLVKNVK